MRAVAAAVAATVLLGALAPVAWAASETAPEPGRPAPPFTLPDLAGTPVRLAAYQGKRVVIINFWATWCPPCREELPTLERLRRARRAELEVLAVNLDAVGRARVRLFARELGLTFPVLLDPELAVGRLYRIRALPVSFVVDRTGVIRHREIGYRDWTDPESGAIVDRALGVR